MIDAVAGQTIEPVLTGAPENLVGTLTLKLRALPSGTIVVAATADGIAEYPQGASLSNYRGGIAIPPATADGTYEAVWTNGAVEVTETVVIGGSSPTVGGTILPILTGAPAGLVGTLTVALRALPSGTVAIAATTAGIVEYAQASTSNYQATITIPTTLEPGTYEVVWANGATEVTESIEVVASDFTYDLDTDIGQVRLEIGDTDEDAYLLTDAEIQVKLDSEGTVQLAAASLCDILAASFARSYDFATDGQSFKRSQMVTHYQSLAKTLRGRANGQAGVIQTRRSGPANRSYIDYTETATDGGTVDFENTGRIARGPQI